ncbi:hypothetical protein [Azospirillum sp. B2RO_4]|uniref:hypothetical protein n=1 Tax=Azospirillum sp. B2RO_4 TaxID=3027796 RepID=UPI003DAA3579
MGADFVEKATPSFLKSWDRGKVELATSDLFTRKPSKATRTAAADIIGNTNLSAGDKLTVEIRGGELFALRGNRSVAKFPNPSPALIQAIGDSCGIAKGTVEQVHIFSGVAEISIC